MNDKKKKGKTYVKPHERKNPKSPGEHKVQGHYRKTGKKTNVREHWREVGGARHGNSVRNAMAIHNELFLYQRELSEKLDSLSKGETVDREPTIRDFESLQRKIEELKERGVISEGLYTDMYVNVENAEVEFRDGDYSKALSDLSVVEDVMLSFDYNEELAEWMEGLEHSNTQSGGSRSGQKDYTGVLNDKAIGYDNIQEVVDKHPDIGGQKEAVEYMRKYHPDWLKGWARQGKL